MKKSILYKMGYLPGEQADTAVKAVVAARQEKIPKKTIQEDLKALRRDPEPFLGHHVYGELACLLQEAKDAGERLNLDPAPYQVWGDDLDCNTLKQMENACRLPVAVQGALMPDGHVGYGLPIGGVLATRNAVIPYAVGVDIACRMKLSVLDFAPKLLDGQSGRFMKCLEEETRFGMGAAFDQGDRRDHPVMEQDWDISPITKRFRDRAWMQLGTSGSGNHFVEFGTFEVREEGHTLPPGEYLAILSHSGSRGPGANVCNHYSRIARSRHPELPKELSHLAWLDLDTADGQEYWAAMNLMGDYAAANHACIHETIAKHLRAKVLLEIENHHNFAWKEVHNGEELIVHRKGATPAGAGEMGIIPGTMASSAYVVRGRGNPESLNSAAHGAGRTMSRRQARESFTWSDAKKLLQQKGVTLMSAGLDEVPFVYKDINEVMAAQQDLVDIVATFHPRIVRMAPEGERPED